MGRKTIEVVDGCENVGNEVAKTLAEQGFSGSEYRTVSILGSQNSGKSTLLNLLFGTSFAILDTARGRFRTTRGVHLSFCPSARVVVVDTEGTDSAERGDAGVVFERRTALFALAISDVVLVNLWTAEVGRYTASGLSLLRTLFEASQRLFTDSGHKRILVVLRDYNYSLNNFPALQSQIHTSMQRIWSEVTDKVFEETFDVEVATLASKDFEGDRFARDVATLRSRFFEASSPASLFPQSPPSVPVDGLDIYYQQLWSSILADKDINLPSQRSLLSHLRCQEIQAAVLGTLDRELSVLRIHAGKSIVKQFAMRCISKLEDAVTQFDAEAGKYAEDAVATAREKLESTAFGMLEKVYRTQLQAAVTIQYRRFQRRLETGPKDKPETAFLAKAEKCMKAAIDEFTAIASGCCIGAVEWSWDSELEELQQQMTRKTAELRELQKQLLRASVTKSMSEHFSSVVTKALQRLTTGEAFWTALNSAYQSYTLTTDQVIEAVLTGIRETPGEIHTFQEEFHQQLTATLRTKVEKRLVHLEDTLRKRFDCLFWRDEHGIPRNWRSTDVAAVKAGATHSVLSLLAAFAVFRVGSAGCNEEPAELLSAEHLCAVKKAIQTHAETAVRDALTLQQGSIRRYSIPTWFLLLLTACGLNELWWILCTPVSMSLLSLSAGLFGLLQVLGLGFLPRHFFHLLLLRLRLFSLP